MRGASWRRAVVCAGVAAAGVLTLSACGAASGEGDDAGRDRATRLVFHDEFSGPAGGEPDPRVWNVQQNADASGSELQCYTDSPDNIATDGDGHLVITALRQEGNCTDGWYRYFTSGRMNTLGRKTFTYGRLEIRARVPDGVGTWPTFWAIGDVADPWPEAGEIDVLETAGRLPDLAIGTIHGPQRDDASQQFFLQVSDTTAQPLASAFHVYGVQWDADGLTWTLDGHPYGTITKAQAEKAGAWVWDHPFALILDLAIGGQYGGEVPDSTVFPQRLVVDWVRVYQ